MEEIKFYPMTEWPVEDESDSSFSKTVIIYGEKSSEIGLGYYDFEMNEWLHLGENIFLLKCWCYIPNPNENTKGRTWKLLAPKGYQKFSF